MSVSKPVRCAKQARESRKMPGRKMPPEARAVFIFLPGIFLLAGSSSLLLQMCPDISFLLPFLLVL
jgi:hypothetical protein